jgi:IS5 family transposase
VLNRGNPQQSFVDLEILSRMIPSDHPLVAIHESVDFSFVTNAVADLYSATEGRPSYPPEVLFRVLFLEIWANLSDVQVCRELQYNLLYRWFCGFRFDDPVPDSSTLVVFRKRLGEERFKELLRLTVEKAKMKGLVSDKWLIVDGTKIEADAAIRNNLELVRESRKRLLRQLAKEAPEKATELKEYGEPLNDSNYATRDELLAAEVSRGRELLQKIDELDDSPRLAAEKDLTSKVLSGSSGIASLSDPDARWGFKRKTKPFLGYKAHISCDENGIVTAARVEAANESEIEQLESLVEEAKDAGVEPARLAADKGYDSDRVRKRIGKSGIRPYIARRSKPTAKRLGEFRYKTTADSVIATCPCGVSSANATPHKKGGFIVYWSERDCTRCINRDACIGNRTRKVLYINPSLETRRPRGMKAAMKIRKTIERVFGDAKKWHRMGRARYRSRARVAIQVILTMIVLNAKKLARQLYFASG